MLNCLSEGINVNENNDLCECPVCHYRYFFDGNFIFEACIFNGCHKIDSKKLQASMILHLLL